MTMQQQQRGSGTKWTGQNGFAVDNPTYNLLQAATSACEAVEAYRKYASDGDEQLFQQLADEQARHAEQLLDALHQRLMSGGYSSGGVGSAGSSGRSGVDESR